MPSCHVFLQDWPRDHTRGRGTHGEWRSSKGALLGIVGRWIGGSEVVVVFLCH
jgi:hypothetical protein